MTPGVKKALRIFLEHGSLTPAQFARRYFPVDHPGWQRHCKCGPKGTHRGGGLVLWAGGFIGKLRRAGLVEACGDLFAGAMHWRLTCAGRKAAGT
jgi:hypothetical protein